jgi:arylsulfatase A-like enzyme
VVWVVAALALLALCAALVLGRALRPQPPLNVIIVSLDDLRADRLGAYGYARDTTPQIDAFAREGVIFTDALTQFTSTWHSHRALFSGRYPFRPGDRVFLAELFRARGYRTAAFTGGGYLNRKFGLDRGFDLYFDAHDYTGLDLTLGPALEWLGQNRNEPFFLFLHTYDIHCPWSPPEPYRSLFVGDRVSGFEIGDKCGKDYFNRIEMTPEDYAVLSAAYDGNLKWADSLLAPLFSHLDAWGLYDTTLVVLLSDHGEGLGEHGGYVGHGALYEEEIRVPLILRMPGVAPGVVDEPAQLMDVVPTVLAALGLELPPDLDGVDLGPYLRGRRSFDGVRPRITQTISNHLAFRVDSRWKLVVDKQGRLEALFDLERAPSENVLTSHPQVARLMKRQLDQLGGAGSLSAAAPPPATTRDPDLAEQLRALGYVD